MCNALKTIVHTNLTYYDYCCDNNTSTEFLCDLIENIYTIVYFKIRKENTNGCHLVCSLISCG